MSAVYIDPDGNEVDSPETETLAGERLVDDMCGAIARYCVLPSEHEYIAVTLWCAYTHLADVFNDAPRVIARSPHKRSGKTRLQQYVIYPVKKKKKKKKTLNCYPQDLPLLQHQH